MTTKIPAELSSTPGIADSSNATAITIDSSENITLTGDISLADSKKVNIGAGNDLQIYHDGSNSFIKEAGTGGLYMPTSAVYMRNAADNAGVAYFVDGGAVTLYHDGTSKFATSSNGGIMYGGITFNGDTATANLLDDYEEGTWSPNYAATGLSVTHDISNGYYTKIGNHVFFSMLIGTNAVSGTSTYHLTITGLPYTALNSAISMSSGGVGLSYKFVNNENGVKWFISANTSEIRFYDGNSNVGAITESNHLSTATTSNRMYITGHYLTA